MILPPTYPYRIVDEVEYGKASGKSVGHAKEMAAHIAHRALLFENFRKLAGMVA